MDVSDLKKEVEEQEEEVEEPEVGPKLYQSFTMCSKCGEKNIFVLLLNVLNPYSAAGIDFRRQNLTSVDVSL